MSLPSQYASLFKPKALCIVDVGARGGLQESWNRIRENCVFVGFEPDAAEAERLQRGAKLNEQYVAKALYSECGMVRFYHCVAPSRSSVYQPNARVVAALYGTTDPFRVLRSAMIPVTTLDVLVAEGAIPAPDFIKLDTQGSELAILKGSTESLRMSLVGLETEVEFSSLYEGQPLFGEVDSFLRDAGYELIGFRHLFTKADLLFWERGDRGYTSAVELLRAWACRLVPPYGSWVGMHQLVYGDAVYFRNPTEYLSSLQKSGIDSKRAILKAVVLATELHCYSYASDVFECATRIGLLNEDDRTELRRYVRKRSRDLTPLVATLTRLSRRALRRLKSPGSRRIG
ncbi:MAG: FkbM family methyltransferase [Vicinamibacterales bacterium]